MHIAMQNGVLLTSCVAAAAGPSCERATAPPPSAFADIRDLTGLIDEVTALVRPTPSDNVAIAARMGRPAVQLRRRSS